MLRGLSLIGNFSIPLEHLRSSFTNEKIMDLLKRLVLVYARLCQPAVRRLCVSNSRGK